MEHILIILTNFLLISSIYSNPSIEIPSTTNAIEENSNICKNYRTIKCGESKMGWSCGSLCIWNCKDYYINVYDNILCKSIGKTFKPSGHLHKKTSVENDSYVIHGRTKKIKTNRYRYSEKSEGFGYSGGVGAGNGNGGLQDMNKLNEGGTSDKVTGEVSRETHGKAQRVKSDGMGKRSKGNCRNGFESGGEDKGSSTGGDQLGSIPKLPEDNQTNESSEEMNNQDNTWFWVGSVKPSISKNLWNYYYLSK